MVLTLHSKPLLVIHPTYRCLHLPTPTSHSIRPPIASPLANTSLFPMSEILCFIVTFICHTQSLIVSMLVFLSRLYWNHFSKGYCSKRLLLLPLLKHWPALLPHSPLNTPIIPLKKHFFPSSQPMRFTRLHKDMTSAYISGLRMDTDFFWGLLRGRCFLFNVLFKLKWLKTSCRW